MIKQYWLLKTEPDSYSIDDFKKDERVAWDGVRNYTARNFMRDNMRKDDGVLFYHSSCKLPGVYGIGRVCSNPYPDPTQFDSESIYFDSKSPKQRPRWLLVDVCFVNKFSTPIYLTHIKKDINLMGIIALYKYSRLSVQPVSKKHFELISKLGQRIKKTVPIPHN